MDRTYCLRYFLFWLVFCIYVCFSFLQYCVCFVPTEYSQIDDDTLLLCLIHLSPKVKKCTPNAMKLPCAFRLKVMLLCLSCMRCSAIHSIVSIRTESAWSEQIVNIRPLTSKSAGNHDTANKSRRTTKPSLTCSILDFNTVLSFNWEHQAARKCVCVCAYSSERSPFQHIRRRHQQGQRVGGDNWNQSENQGIRSTSSPKEELVQPHNLSVGSTAGVWNQTTHPIHSYKWLHSYEWTGDLTFDFDSLLLDPKIQQCPKRKGINIQPSTSNKKTQPRRHTHTNTLPNTPTIPLNGASVRRNGENHDKSKLNGTSLHPLVQ